MQILLKMGIAAKLQLAIQSILLLLSIVAASSFYASQRDAELKGEEEKIKVMADGVINGANMLMQSGIISDVDQRKLFIQKMSSSENVKSLRLIRNKLVQKQFGQGLPEEQPAGPEELRALEDGKVFFETRGDVLHGIVPYTASKNFRGTNCLTCHDVPEGYRNGASVIDVDISANNAILKDMAWKSIAAIALLQIFLWLLTKFILQKLVADPMRRMKTAMVEIGDSCDLTRRVEVNGEDEVGQAAGAFNGLMETLQGAFGQLHSGIEKVAMSSDSLSQSSQHLAASASDQSEAASSMASTVEQLTVSISEVTENARTALQYAQSSGELSEHGGEIIHHAADEIHKIAATVRQTSDLIQNLGEQSSRISSIVMVIHEIAEQTNLLALNAAIEAARAGEQGRGFAVVADEVRKLAERTRKATEEVTGMIDSIQVSSRSAVDSMVATVGLVDGGVSLAQQAGEAINQIKVESQHSHVTVGDISSALMEQKQASSDIATTVERVAQMTEENSAAATKTATAADELAQLAGDMRSTVNRFKI